MQGGDAADILEVTDAATNRATADILGPFCQSNSGNRYVLLVVDYPVEKTYAITECSTQTVVYYFVWGFIQAWHTI